jgi:hypothetical protein
MFFYWPTELVVSSTGTAQQKEETKAIQFSSSPNLIFMDSLLIPLLFQP